MAQDKQVTWGGRFAKGPDALMQQFSESVTFDKRLALFDIEGSQAHARMLNHVGLLSADECEAIEKGLNAIAEQISAGTFIWQIALEDVHMNIEQALTKDVPAAAKLHTARSRNDQIATDMRLFFKQACQSLVADIAAAITSILRLAEQSKKIAIPGYTHLQRAQPVYVAHHLMAWVEMLGRDGERLMQVHDRANWCPLGSGAIAGTTLPIDREFVARELGFVDSDGNPRVTRNSMDAVADRDVFVEFLSACALCGVHLSRMAEDLILWASSEFGYVALADNFTTGSSLMPQKKNPDSLELIRGKSGRLQGHLTALLTMTKGLPLTYNRDLQEDKPPVFDAFDQLGQCLKVMEGTLGGTRFIEDKCRQAVADPMLLATDLVDYLVMKGVAFRDAHHRVGALVALAEKQAVPLNELPLAAVREIEPAFAADWIEVFDVEKALAKRELPGMPGPETVRGAIAMWNQRLREWSDFT